MKPKLILHAGTHKTGTTAIQAFAARHRDALAGRGILYPDLAPLGIEHGFPQHRFAHALADKDKTLGPADAARLAGLWAEAAAARGAVVFVSAEPLYRYTLAGPGDDWLAGRARYLDRLAAALAPFEVEVALAFRRPDDFVRSLFQENVSRARTPKWARFPAFRAHATGGALRYADSAALFAERFAGLRCLIYEDLPGGAGFAPAVFAALGLDAAGLAPVGVVRESFSPAQTQAKLALHLRLGDGVSKAALQGFLRRPEVTALLAERLGPGPFDLWENAAARDGFLAAQAPEIERLRAAHFPGRAALFPPPRPLAPPVPPIDAALAAQLAEMAAAAGIAPAPARKAALAARLTEMAAAAGIAATPARKAARAAAGAPARAADAPARAKAAPAASVGPEADGAAIRDFVLIVGAMKSGTTSLYQHLAAHPAIAHCRRKEPNFFARERDGRRAAAQYYALWPGFDPAVHRYAMEASASYTKFPRPKGVPARMARFAAAQGVRFKLIYILRDPVDRVESHLAHNIARRDPPDPTAPDLLAAAIGVSSYARQIRRFLRRFPREDLLILDFDDLVADPRALLDRAFGFLGLETPADLAPLPPANPLRDANGSAAFRLDPDQRAKIAAALRKDVVELRDAYGVNVDKWGVV